MTSGTTYSGVLDGCRLWSNYSACDYVEAGEERVYTFIPSATGSTCSPPHKPAEIRISS